MDVVCNQHSLICRCAEHLLEDNTYGIKVGDEIVKKH